VASVEILGCSEPWVYGTLGSYGSLGSSDSIGTLGSSDSSDPIGTLGPSENPPPSSSSFKWRLGGGGGGERGRVRALVASRMLVQIFLESYGTVAAVSAPLVMHVSSSSYHILTRCGTVVALSAPLVMPLCDSHIPINVPFTFRDKQPCLIFYRARLRGGSRATASIEPLASLIRLSIMSSLERRRRRCRLLVRRLVQPKLDGVRGPPTAGTAPSAPCDSQD
jgi:hypothetical protein